MAKQAKEESAKKTKQKNGSNKKLKRTILGTLSGVCMASALIVAAIPVKEAEAVDPTAPVFAENASAKVNLDGTIIPEYMSDTTGKYIYYRSDGRFGVERVTKDNDYKGVLVYFKDGTENLGTVSIPREIEAYKYYFDSTTRLNVLCPVNVNGDFLYYMPTEITTVSDNEIIEENPPFDSAKKVMCTVDNENEWRTKEAVYLENGLTSYTPLTEGVTPGSTTAPYVMPISYIGSTRWVVTTEAEQPVDGHYYGAGDLGDPGVFAGVTNFSSINIPGTIAAIGDNAFKNCGVGSVNIGAGVSHIGNHAFDGCISLSSVNLRENDATSTSLKQIGEYAFANCNVLSSIDIPDSVEMIGNGCFMNDVSLYSANLYGHPTNTTDLEGNTRLTLMGNGAFYNCSSLRNMYLPRLLQGTSNATHWFYGCESMTDLILPPENGGNLSATNVKGCYQLLTVKVPSQTMTFNCPNSGSDYCDGKEAEDTFGCKNLGFNTTFDDFKVNDAFRIICYRNSQAYDYACRHEYSVEYLNPDELGKLERVKNNFCFTIEGDPDNGVGTLTHIVPYKATGDVSIVNIPDQIGVYKVNKIRTGVLSSFDRKKEIEYVYMPESVREIGDSCFVGCEGLSEVEFANANAVEYIGTDAFKTQTMDPNINLHFVGDISRAGAECEPFKYAMNMENKYNDPNNPGGTKYISYISPFPSNLQVELVVKTERDEETGITKTTATPTLVGAPDFERDFRHPENYSLSSNRNVRDKQLAIVAGALDKYNKQVSGNTIFDISEFNGSDNERAVLNAVLHASVPEGVYNMKPEVYQGNKYLQSVTLNGISDVPDEAFAGCDSLKSFYMNSSGVEGGERLGKNVFLDDDFLMNVTLPSTLSTIDTLPFYKCSALEKVNFPGNPKFSCSNGIIYELKDDGTRKIVECLEKRGRGVSGSTLDEEEFANVSEIAPAAFMGCDGISVVYFGEAPVAAIPENCFRDCTDLGVCALSPATESIGQYAFRNTKLSGIKIPNGNAAIRESSFTQEDGVSLIPGMTIECEVPSTVATYAKNMGFEIKELKIPTYTVRFFTYDGLTQICDPQTVKYGSDAIAPEAPVRDGWVHTGWFPDYTNVKSDLDVLAVYEPAGEDTRPIYTVRFMNMDGTIAMKTEKVREGDAATPPAIVPDVDGYTFLGYWLPEYNNIISDLDVYPQYKKGTSPGGGTNNGGNNDNNNNDNNNNNNKDNNKNNTGSNKKPSSSTTKPSTEDTSTATKPGTTTNTTNNTTNSTAKPGTATNGTVSQNKTNKNNGTSIVVTKPGISNADLISATVNGSTDDFVVKISDSDAAKAAVEQALLNEYGSLNDIRYFAMDISLYDKTGTTKIQNLNGISVTITMPIPDALTSYGGNNKAGAVVNGTTLEKLETRFTTINGVPCISFVARHFSPYTIYTDLNNMTASLNGSDMTPKTGDPIHPKWFLSIGLALISVVLFFLKGSNKKVVKVIA